jgi:hypothetical protein
MGADIPYKKLKPRSAALLHGSGAGGGASFPALAAADDIANALRRTVPVTQMPHPCHCER